MTDEEMAEEWAKENMDCVKTVSYLNHDCNYFSDEERCVAKSAYLAGLKAGRPKWHKVADGDLPKDEEYKWCVSQRGYPYVARYEEVFVSWTNRENKEVMCPYAWKEIVLPELKEIK